MKVGIVGHEGAKFSAAAQAAARALIRELLAAPDSVGVSGECPLGGVDIWAKEEAARLGRAFIPFPPKVNSWEDGFKPRNIQIAEASDVVHVIVVTSLPKWYSGRRFSECYHCHTKDHVKSGGCWTGKYAEKIGKQAVWHLIEQEQA